MSVLKVIFESESHLNIAVARSKAFQSGMRSWVRSSCPAALELTLQHMRKIFISESESEFNGDTFK